MKKLFVMTAIVALLGIAACGRKPSSDVSPSSDVGVSMPKEVSYGDRFSIFSINNSPYEISYIITDKETGCKYMQADLDGGATPLLKADGTPDCNGGLVSPNVLTPN